MNRVTVTRTIDAPADAVEDAILDVGPFMRAGGFDEVTVDGDEVRIANAVGFLRIELDLELVDRPDAVLAYRQRDGIFEEMETRFRVEEGDETTVVGETEFAVDVEFVGPIFDATVVKRQRRRELNAQFDYLEREA